MGGNEGLKVGRKGRWREKRGCELPAMRGEGSVIMLGALVERFRLAIRSIQGFF